MFNKLAFSASRFTRCQIQFPWFVLMRFFFINYLRLNSHLQHTFRLGLVRFNCRVIFSLLTKLFGIQLSSVILLTYGQNYFSLDYLIFFFFFFCLHSLVYRICFLRQTGVVEGDLIVISSRLSVIYFLDSFSGLYLAYFTALY